MPPGRPKSINKHRAFPKLSRKNNAIISDPDPRYNCVAFAAGITNHRYWPNKKPDYDWPADIPSAELIDSFIRFYESFGFKLMPGGNAVANYNYTAGVEKIALFANSRGEPQHAALQVGPNKWKSKLGPWYDIEHTDGAVSDGDYGHIVAFMQRQAPKAGAYSSI